MLHNCTVMPMSKGTFLASSCVCRKVQIDEWKSKKKGSLQKPVINEAQHTSVHKAVLIECAAHLHFPGLLSDHVTV